MGRIPENFEKTVLFVAKKLRGKQYAFRGTTSLVLQGLDFNVDDIDILTDKKSALECNEIFRMYLVEKVAFKQSDKFKSYYGKFEIHAIQVEVMGDWQIRAKKWSEVYDASDDEVEEIEITEKLKNPPAQAGGKTKKQKIKVTKVETELDMFAKMGRWTAYQKIRCELEKKGQNYLF